MIYYSKKIIVKAMGFARNLVLGKAFPSRFETAVGEK